MVGGWVKLWRVLLDKPIWLNSTPEQKSILITLLLMANHKEAEWDWGDHKFSVSPGQFVTSLDGIRAQCGQGISIRNVRTALVRFRKLEFLTYQSTKTGRVVSIVNWPLYQGENGKGDKETDIAEAETRQTTDKDPTTNKKGRTKEEEHTSSSPTLPTPDGGSPQSKKRKQIPDERVRPAIDYFCKQYLAEVGKPYPVNGEKDGKLLRRLPKAYTTQVIFDLMDLFFADKSDAFVWEKAGPSIGVFITKVSALAVKLGKQRGGSDPCQETNRKIEEIESSAIRPLAPIPRT